MAVALRIVSALEFAFAIGAWAGFGLEWYVADLFATTALIAFLCTFPEPEWVPA